MKGTRKVILMRHSFKSKEEGLKHTLSEDGKLAARCFRIPKSWGKLTVIGGSSHIRTYQTVVEVAAGNKLDPKILAGDFRLGSEDQFVNDFKTDLEEYMRLMAEEGCTDIQAVKKLCTSEQILLLKQQLSRAVRATMAQLQPGECALLGTHTPYIEMAIEIWGEREFNQQAEEMAYVVLEADEGPFQLRDVRLVTYQYRGVAKKLLEKAKKK